MNGGKRKPVCSYGKECYRKNSEHLKKYSHDGDDEESSKPELKPKPTFTPKRPLRQTTLTFARVGTPRPKPPDGPLPQTTRFGRNEKPADPSRDSEKREGERKPAPATSQDSTNYDSQKERGPETSENKREDHRKLGPQLKKRKTLSPKGANKGQKKDISSSDDSDEEGIGDVSSHSWTFEKNKNEEKFSSASDSEESEKEAEVECNTPPEIIKHLFLVDMPDDFYSFYDFCENLNGKDPKKALCEFGLRLVGAFDVLSGDLKPGVIPQNKALCHWRFYMDPPEMQTVLLGDEGVHYGYWRDEPNTKEPFVASNTVPECKFQAAGANLFSVAVNHMEGYIRSCNPFEKVKAGKILSALKQWAEDRSFDLADTPAMTNRKKKVVAATFHCLGIVVPVQPKTDVGYRPLIETNANLRKFCQSVINAKTKEDRETRMENIDRLVNAANIANDECDFGNALELGIDLFCMGSKIFHKTVEHLLTTAYTLLNRPEYAKIIRAHLKNRRTSRELSVLK